MTEREAREPESSAPWRERNLERIRQARRILEQSRATQRHDDDNDREQEPRAASDG